MKPLPFHIMGAPSLIQAMLMELKALGYTTTYDALITTAIQSHYTNNWKNKEQYLQLCHVKEDYSTGHGGSSFRLPEQWNEALAFCTKMISDEVWPVFKPGDWLYSPSWGHLFRFESKTEDRIWYTELWQGGIKHRDRDYVSNSTYTRDTRLATPEEITKHKQVSIAIRTNSGSVVNVGKRLIAMEEGKVLVDDVRRLHKSLQDMNKSYIGNYPLKIDSELPLFHIGCQGPFSLDDIDKVIQAADSLK